MQESNVAKINFNDNNKITKTINTVKIPLKDDDLRKIIFENLTNSSEASLLMNKIITEKNNNRKVYNRIKHHVQKKK